VTAAPPTTTTPPPPSLRAVWSFWTRPFRAFHRGTWASERHHLLAWALSVETARRHYPDTALCTDSEGARLLVDGLGLPFAQVSTALDRLAGADPEWWGLGKLHAYRAQEAPFLHIDSDVFLWSPLPPDLAAAPVIVQNPEVFAFGDPGSWYQPQAAEAAIRATGGWLPEAWWAFTARRAGLAYCCGILGGHRTEALRDYADCAIRVIGHPANAAAWARIGDRIGSSVLFEQYLLAACLAHRGVTPGCLFESAEESWDPAAARRAGYTHLIAGAKADPELARRLEARVRRDHPEIYERVLRLAPPLAA
jgi:hypothetical protein